MARSFKMLRINNDFLEVEISVNGTKKVVVYSTSPGEENILEHIDKEMDIMENPQPNLGALVKKNIGKDIEIIKEQETIVDTRRTKYIDTFKTKIK